MKFKVSDRVSRAALSLMLSMNITIIGYLAYEKCILGTDVAAEGRESMRSSSILYGKDTKEREEDRHLKEEDFYKPKLTARQRMEIDRKVLEEAKKI